MKHAPREWCSACNPKFVKLGASDTEASRLLSAEKTFALVSEKGLLKDVSELVAAKRDLSVDEQQAIAVLCKPYRVSFVGAYDLSAVDVAPNPADIDYGVLPLTGYIAPVKDTPTPSQPTPAPPSEPTPPTPNPTPTPDAGSGAADSKPNAGNASGGSASTSTSGSSAGRVMPRMGDSTALLTSLVGVLAGSSLVEQDGLFLVVGGLSSSVASYVASLLKTRAHQLPHL